MNEVEKTSSEFECRVEKVCNECQNILCCQSGAFRKSALDAARHIKDRFRQMLIVNPSFPVPHLVEFSFLDHGNIDDYFIAMKNENSWDGVKSLIADCFGRIAGLEKVLVWISEFVDPASFKDKLMQINADPKPEDTQETSQNAGSQNN